MSSRSRKYNYPNVVVEFRGDLTITPDTDEQVMRDFIYFEIRDMISRGEVKIFLEEHNWPKTLTDVADAVSLLDCIPEDKWDGWFVYCNTCRPSGTEPDEESIRHFLDIYLGEWETLGDYLRENSDKFVTVTKEQLCWIDWDLAAVDFEDQFKEVDGHIFHRPELRPSDYCVEGA